MSSNAIVQENDTAPHADRSSNRPRLLISVRNAAEALIALDGGAEWIDLKEPLAGPLGAVDAGTARQVVGYVAGQYPVSAALGELVQWENSSARKLIHIEGIEVVKLGLAGCAFQADWKAQWQSISATIRQAGKQLVAVAYADWEHCQAPSPREVIHCCAAEGIGYLLLDTYDKQFGSVLSYLPGDALGEVLCLARESSLQTVVAGGLSRGSLLHLPDGIIDLIAVRGAACGGDRIDSIDARRVEEFCEAIAARWPL